jgi:glycoside/pentoside/hexuronide:cation symporter, GPH family
VLSRRVELLWASHGVGTEALLQSRNVWLIYFYAPPESAGRGALLSLGTVSLLLFLGKLIEAFDDTLIGHWSDRTQSRLGRRLPFILGATPLWALFAFLIFVPPRDASGPAVAIWFFVTLQCFHMFATLSTGPYEALLPELARTSAARVRMVGYRVSFGVLGAAIGLVGSGLLVERFGFGVMAALMAGLALLGRYLGMASVWTQARASRPVATLPLRAALRATFSNRGFLLLLPSTMLFGAGLAMLVGLLPYYVHAVFGAEREGLWVALLTAVVIGAMAGSIPLFAALARRTSKQHAYRVAMLGAVGTLPLIAIGGFLPGVPLLPQVLLVMALVGVPLAGVFLFPGALVADICDHDARRTGARREATFYGAREFAEKTAASLAPLLLALVLMLGNSSADPLGIRLAGPLAASLVLGGYLIFRHYDLPEDVEITTPVARHFD